jgi:fermentation-respiration switch protein FrsA (DUF1100 family)
MHSFLRKTVLSIMKVVVLAYTGVLILLMFFENRQVYQPLTADQDWQPAPSANIQDVELTTHDGVRLHAWWCPYKDPATRRDLTADGAVLYCHGNAGNLSHRGGSIQKMAEILQLGVLIIDYPGYGKSAGSPSEIGCYAAADAGYDWLVDERRIDPGQIILYGGSLGGGVAVDLASRREHRALILAKTFTSMPDVGQSIFPWLPVRWLMRNRFNNLNKIEFCRRPVFIANSMEDELIPFSHGQKLFAAANEPKMFVELKGGHNEALTEDFFRPLMLFLRDPTAQIPARCHLP